MLTISLVAGMAPGMPDQVSLASGEDRDADISFVDLYGNGALLRPVGGMVFRTDELMPLKVWVVNHDQSNYLPLSERTAEEKLERTA